jgi:hypothetical protein
MGLLNPRGQKLNLVDKFKVNPQTVNLTKTRSVSIDMKHAVG